MSLVSQKILKEVICDRCAIVFKKTEELDKQPEVLINIRTAAVLETTLSYNDLCPRCITIVKKLLQGIKPVEKAAPKPAAPKPAVVEVKPKKRF